MLLRKLAVSGPEYTEAYAETAMNPFDGMTHNQSTAMVTKMMKQGKRWPTDNTGKQAAYDATMDAIENAPPHVQMKAVQNLLMMERQNQVDDVASLGISDQSNRQPQVVLLLPTNQTEVMPADAAEDDGHAAAEHGERDSVNDAAEGGYSAEFSDGHAADVDGNQNG